MSWKRHRIILIGMFLILAGCGTPRTATEPTVGHQAPGFQLQEINDKGQTLSLQQLLDAHKPIILNAFASWCDPCRQETPDLVKMAAQYRGQILIVGVNMTQDDQASDVQKFINTFHIKYPVLLDKKGDFMDEYNISGFPTTFVLSSEGKIISVHVGSLTEQQMQSVINQALHGSKKS